MQLFLPAAADVSTANGELVVQLGHLGGYNARALHVLG